MSAQLWLQLLDKMSLHAMPALLVATETPQQPDPASHQKVFAHDARHVRRAAGTSRVVSPFDRSTSASGSGPRTDRRGRRVAP
ncbi:hypothetical protein LX32DRAFT_640562 [Colletotrichum zoysiae]|uniref:Uncharacterized protein n=1 Tax=Colletotrichum zoysiae TaxID=1216348 RepID=A0AAD9HFD3_9PEZI|nr:hypothetical protein LX32DRAFT_640562 [Colletotrichum zoysiae]